MSNSLKPKERIQVYIDPATVMRHPEVASTATWAMSKRLNLSELEEAFYGYSVNQIDFAHMPPGSPTSVFVQSIDMVH